MGALWFQNFAVFDSNSFGFGSGQKPEFITIRYHFKIRTKPYEKPARCIYTVLEILRLNTQKFHSNVLKSNKLASHLKYMVHSSST